MMQLRSIKQLMSALVTSGGGMAGTEFIRTGMTDGALTTVLSRGLAMRPGSGQFYMEARVDCTEGVADDVRDALVAKAAQSKSKAAASGTSEASNVKRYTDGPLGRVGVCGLLFRGSARRNIGVGDAPGSWALRTDGVVLAEGEEVGRVDALTIGDTVGIAIDCTAGTVSFSVNGTPACGATSEGVDTTLR